MWYVNYKKRNEVTQPKLNNTPNITKYLEIILFCGSLYAYCMENWLI